VTKLLDEESRAMRLAIIDNSRITEELSRESGTLPSLRGGSSTLYTVELKLKLECEAYWVD
jgi:hypothetical protein